LKFNNDGQFSLVSFSPREVPPYAILSHTWAAKMIKSLSKTLPTVWSTRKGTKNSVSVESKQGATICNTSGLILAASTNQTVQNSQNHLAVCSAGIRTRLSAKSIYRMSLPTMAVGDGKRRSVVADGLREVGHFRSCLHRKLSSSSLLTA